MSAKSISHCQGKGSINHNNRLFFAKNVNVSNTKSNIYFVCQDISEAYHKCFDSALSEYNARQKRTDRKIKGNYFNYLFGKDPCGTVLTSSDKRKSFYEDLVQIGTKDDTGVNTPDAKIATSCLTEYMSGFQKRNPNFYVFNAVIHLDEATPHLHIDYIPIGHYKRGMSKQNGIAQALKEMGYGSGIDAISKWREQERKVLRKICNNHGIEIKEERKSRGYSLTCEEYKNYKDEIKSLESNENALKTRSKKLLDKLHEEKEKLLKLKSELSEVELRLGRYKKVESAIEELMNINPKKNTFMGNDFVVDPKDWHKLKRAAINGCTAISEVESLRKLAGYENAYYKSNEKLKEAQEKIQILENKIADYELACERNPDIEKLVWEEKTKERTEIEINRRKKVEKKSLLERLKMTQDFLEK